MNRNELRCLLAESDFCAVDAINGGVAGGSAAQCENPVLRDKPQMHQVALDLFREVQRR
jgi:hypothetical protein